MPTLLLPTVSRLTLSALCVLPLLSPPAKAQSLGGALNPPSAFADPQSAAPTPTPAPPTAQAYAVCTPGVRLSGGRTMVPLAFLSTGLGASTGKIGDFYRVAFFDHTLDLYPYQNGARFDGQQIMLPAMPQIMSGQLYVPWQPIADLLGIRWSLAGDDSMSAPQSTLLLQYPGAYIQSVRPTASGDKLRVVVELSNATRVVASQKDQEVIFSLSAARVEGVPGLLPVKDTLVPRVLTTSGNWSAKLSLSTNYRAPIRWFTMGNPPRLVIDAHRLFEEKTNERQPMGITLTKIRKGTSDGPVQMFLARLDPRDGWRVRVAPAGDKVTMRARPSHIASRHRAPLAINGGFFAYDGAAVGAVMIDGQWLRLPWKARTAIAFRPDGKAKIGNLQTQARVVFGNGLSVPIRDLNGWPDKGTISAITRKFGTYYALRPGEIAVVVSNDTVVSKPGSGHAPVYPNGFTLVASGEGAQQWFNTVQRGMSAAMSIRAPGWDGYTTALGGGPRLVQNGRVQVTALRENFRADVRVGRGPRTAIGVDKMGRYIVLVVDGRRPNYSIGMTLTELAFTMQKLGAVDALNMDGGGSTSMTIQSHVVNRPSDGVERKVSNALLVMR